MPRILFPFLLLALAAGGAGAASVTAEASGDGEDAALQRMHDAFVDAFVDSEGFGKRRITPMMIQMRRYQFDGIGDSGRCVADVELIGIARHDPPVVHAGSFMGFQHREGGDALPAVESPGRGLHAWERDALAQLAAGQALVVRTTERGERVMGPIRARRACLACHAGAREGDVLGALSYALGRTGTFQENQDRRICRP